MSNNPILIPVLRVLALQKTAQLVLCCLIALPLGFPKTGTDLAEAQWFRGSVLAAFFAEQQGVTHLGLRPWGELTPLNIVCVCGRIRSHTESWAAHRSAYSPAGPENCGGPP